MLNRATLYLSLALLSLPLATCAQAPRIASTDWLAQHLRDRGQVIVDLRDDIKAYWAGHLPGAQWVSPEALRWPDGGVPGKLLPRDQLVQLLAALGVTSETRLVIYAEQSDYRPAYLAWALDVLGHPHWTILDGGFKRWTTEPRPVTQEFPLTIACAPSTYTAPSGTPRLNTMQVRQSKDQPGWVLLDVRSKKAYIGAEGSFIRKGHIPGALSHPWTDDITAEGVWKGKTELQAAYTAQGVTPGKFVITSCGQGLMSAHTYVTLRYLLGYPNVTNYDGGLNDWSSHPDLPVNTGEQP